jgi:hypothetical protein
VRVSLGRVQEEEVKNTWSIRYASLATMTTRAPQAIYLEYIENEAYLSERKIIKGGIESLKDRMT